MDDDDFEIIPGESSDDNDTKKAIDTKKASDFWFQLGLKSLTLAHV
jgi:hypothetical protein